ncbi:MAG TPA: DUF423 domain-containing protein [Caulobacteraceae bacterium]|jgi:uncharacterized membrane protein YgdD (TMEM256/DUF423 family)|nr:DUF423 domain-containing protein [Caulobacteraceae bacterium]
MERAGEGWWVRLAALCGLAAVIAGAFGAHGVTDPMAKELLRTASTYGLVHALATIGAVLLARQTGRSAGVAPGLFLAGELLFCGSLYALALGAPRWVGAITPLGGLSFMGGWAALVFSRGRPAPLASSVDGVDPSLSP